MLYRDQDGVQHVMDADDFDWKGPRPPDDPRAVTGKTREEAEAYTERFNREVLGLKPLTAKQKAAKQATLDAILHDIGWSDTE